MNLVCLKMKRLKTWKLKLIMKLNTQQVMSFGISHHSKTRYKWSEHGCDIRNLKKTICLNPIYSSTVYWVEYFQMKRQKHKHNETQCQFLNQFDGQAAAHVILLPLISRPSGLFQMRSKMFPNTWKVHKSSCCFLWFKSEPTNDENKLQQTTKTVRMVYVLWTMLIK